MLQPAGDVFNVDDYLNDCRELVLDEILQLVPRESPLIETLYRPMLDYPLRKGKALRPAICVAVCRALGGTLAQVLPSATALELYHNAFLIHDDVEDGSEKRRESATLHEKHGVPIAINIGDAMLALTLRPLLANTRQIGVGLALRVLDLVSRMARESAEGQAVELDWIRRNLWQLEDDDYVFMVTKKTTWYTFIAPLVIGATIAGTDRLIPTLQRFGELLGAAFQIQDDLLNLVESESEYGKEPLGDLWEGKHTLILMHALRTASQADRARAIQILHKPRVARAVPPRLQQLLASLVASGELSAHGRVAIVDAVACPTVGTAKTVADVRWLRELIERRGSIPYAQTVARERARRAAAELAVAETAMTDSPHRAFLRSLVDFVVGRIW